MGCGKSNTNAKNVGITNEVTLHYFDGYGRAEVIRMILYYSNTSFTDHRVQPPKWPEFRDMGFCEFGALPVLEIDGHKLVETRAITRYLCRKLNYYPANLADSYWVESLCDFREAVFQDIFERCFKKDLEGMKKYYLEDIPYCLGKIEARLVRNHGGNGWFVGDKISMADFEVFSFVWDYFLYDAKKGEYEMILIQHAPKVKAWADRFLASSPTLKKYLDSRAPSYFGF